MFDDKGRCIRVIGTAIDITARKAAEHGCASSTRAGARVARTLAEKNAPRPRVEEQTPRAGPDLAKFPRPTGPSSDATASSAVSPRLGGRSSAHDPAAVSVAVAGRSSARTTRTCTQRGLEMRRRGDADRLASAIVSSTASTRCDFLEDLGEGDRRLSLWSRRHRPKRRDQQRLRARPRRAAPVAEDGGDGPAHRRRRPRLQQPADPDHRRARHAAAARRLGGERERRLIDGALQSAERAKTLVQRLLAFARRQPLQPSAGRSSAALVAGHGRADRPARSGPQIDVCVDVGDDLPPAMADPNQLEMALLNLAVNARDAMPDGGDADASPAARESVRERHHRRCRRATTSGCRVADTGVGMDEATLRAGGRAVLLDQGHRQGHRARPVDGARPGRAARRRAGDRERAGRGHRRRAVAAGQPERRADAANAAVPAPAAPWTAGTALLVDDEELVRMSTADMLIDLGYEVVEAAIGRGGAAPRRGAAGAGPPRHRPPDAGHDRRRPRPARLR